VLDYPEDEAWDEAERRFRWEYPDRDFDPKSKDFERIYDQVKWEESRLPLPMDIDL
jgi:hypothetical protein